MSVFQGAFLGYLLGVCVTMLCVHLAGGQLYGKENAPDDDRASEPEQTKMDKSSIAQDAQVGKKERSAKWKR